MAESLAAFRDQRSADLRKLAEEHLQHDLSQSDRDTLRSAGSRISMHSKIGSLVGLGLGVYCAIRLRTMRVAYFKAFRAMEKPVEVKFADGRTRKAFHLSHSIDANVCRTCARYNSPACPIQVGRCCYLLLLFPRRTFLRRRTRVPYRYCLSIANNNQRPRGEGAD